MPRLPRWTGAEAERALLEAGFLLLRSEGSHRIHPRGTRRLVLPYHSGVSNARSAPFLWIFLEAGADLPAETLELSL